MAATAPIILILGAGPKIGIPVTKHFLSQGYKVALAARSLNESESTENQLHIKADFAKPQDVVDAFTKVKKTLGIPNVVLYNAGSATQFSPPNDPFAISLSAFEPDMTVNTTSVFVAAQQAVAGFKELPVNVCKTFFFTGNILNVQIIPGFAAQGAGKSASAHLIEAAAAAYKDVGYRFYYVDERKANGSAKYQVDGEAHAKLFDQLVKAKEQGPWLQSFVKDIGYQRFQDKSFA